MRREKLRLIQQVMGNVRKLVSIHKREQAPHAFAVIFLDFNVFGNVRVVVDKPLHAALEARKTVDNVLLESFDGQQGNQSDQRAHFQVMAFPVGKMQDVIVETVFVVPEFDAFAAAVVHRVRDMHEMFEELAGYTFISGVLTSEFERDGKHVQAVHTHPAGAIGLFKVTAGGERSRAVEYADVVETKEPALENVHTFGVLAIHPPGEIQQKLVEGAFEEIAVRFAADAFLNLINTPGRPSVNGWIHIAKGPFIGG